MKTITWKVDFDSKEETNIEVRKTNGKKTLQS